MAMTNEEIKKKMEANSAAWHTADDATKKKLEAENQALGKQIGGTYIIGRCFSLFSSVYSRPKLRGIWKSS